MAEQKKLTFTVDLPALLREGALLLAQIDAGGASRGVVFGYSTALGHFTRLAQVATDLGDPGLLLRLYALGIVESPVEFCKERGTWGDEYDQLAAELAAQ